MGVPGAGSRRQEAGKHADKGRGRTGDKEKGRHEDKGRGRQGAEPSAESREPRGAGEPGKRGNGDGGTRGTHKR